MNENMDSVVLWSIDDDSFFCARDLLQHRMECGRILFLTWNEDYLLNFAFKISKNNEHTSLTRIRLRMPFYKGIYECIQQMLIIDYNTFVLMESGLVYYFIDTKNIEVLANLRSVKCLAAINAGCFSLIRCCLNDNGYNLYLEIYLDTDDIRNPNTFNETLLRRYNITFDEYNIFSCCWIDERYTLNTFLINMENQELLNRLFKIDGEMWRQPSRAEEDDPLIPGQIVHIFTISGNLFMLIDGEVSAESAANRNVTNFKLIHLNYYSSNIECVKIEFRKQLLIVLLESGLIDVWYVSYKMQRALKHRTIQLLTQYLHYDYCPLNSTFYFVFDNQIGQITINTNSNLDRTEAIQKDVQAIHLNPSEECVIDEVYKPIAGMVACTWCESMQQLICLSFNNIFYGITFFQKVITKKEEGIHEVYNDLYELTNERIQILLQHSHLLNDLIMQPKELRRKIEDEHHKRLVLAISNRKARISKLFKAFVSFYTYNPMYDPLNNNNKNIILLKTTNSNEIDTSKRKQISENNYFICINLQCEKSTDVFTPLDSVSFWYLHFSTNEESALSYLPNGLLREHLLITIECNTINSGEIKSISNMNLNLLTFIDDIGRFLCIRIPIELRLQESSFCNLFTRHYVYNMALDNSGKTTINCLTTKPEQHVLEVKHVVPVPHRKLFVNLLETLNIVHAKSEATHIPKELQPEPSVITNTHSLYYLNTYLLTLHYDEKSSSFIVASRHPMAILYLKLHYYLQIRAQGINSESINTEKDSQLEIDFAAILKHKCGMERANGLLEMNTAGTSSNMEILKNYYHQLRNEFCKLFT